MSERDRRFRLSRDEAVHLSEQFGTPLYVLDEATIRARIQEFRSATAAVWPNFHISYASKANGTLAVLAIACQEGCTIDVASEGEFRAALAAGVPAGQCCLHGNNKSREEIEFARSQSIGEIVIDNFVELELHLSLPHESPTRYFLRVAPGVDPITHEKISTGQEVTKFGFSLANGDALRAATQCLESGLPLAGFHCHVGSQLMDAAAQEAGASALATLALELYRQTGYVTPMINAGGGLGVRYTNEQPESIASYVGKIAHAIRKAWPSDLPLPALGQEPGRALVAEAGVTLYEVGVVKLAGGTRFVIVNGGLADNPRPALYGARYAVERVASCSTPHSREPRGGAARTVVSGRHCETDELFPDVDLPEDLNRGDLLQVLTTGAYSSSMASNYNRYPRPASVLRRLDGSFVLVQRSEAYDEMLMREQLPAEWRVRDEN